MIRPDRRVWAFLLRFLVVYVLLMLPWPESDDAYRALFIGTGRVVFRSFAGADALDIERLDEHGQTTDTRLWVERRDAGGRVWTDVSCTQVAYLPTVVLVSLILATPIPSRRRGWALLYGFILVHLFIALRVGAMLIYAANLNLLGADPGNATLWTSTVAAAMKFFSVGQGVSYVAPVLIWMLVALHREDLALVLPIARPCVDKQLRGACAGTSRRHGP